MREQTAQQPPIKRRASAMQADRGYVEPSSHIPPHYTTRKQGQPYLDVSTEETMALDENAVGDDQYYEPPRLPNSVRRYIPTDHYTNQQGQQVIKQGNRQLVIHYDEPPPQYRKRRMHFHWLFWVGVVLFIAVAGTWLLNNVGTWWLNKQNDWSYGMPRTYQTDAVLFTGDTPETRTHVIALNLNGRIEIIVMPQGKAQNAKIYDGVEIFAPDPSLVPVTVSFQDVDGSGKKAMLVHVGTQTIIYPNDGKAFQTPKQ